MQESPAKLGTPLVFGFCYVSSLCFPIAPCCSDQGADLGQHFWGLDKYMIDDVGKLLDLFSLTHYKIYFFIFQQAQGLSGYTSPDGECSAFFFLIYPFLLTKGLSGYTLPKVKNF